MSTNQISYNIWFLLTPSIAFKPEFDFKIDSKSFFNHPFPEGSLRGNPLLVKGEDFQSLNRHIINRTQVSTIFERIDLEDLLI